MTGHGQRAKALFEEGYNCAQSVFGAYAEELGLELPMALRLASGFGGGIGRLRETCGAFSGAVLVLSMARGYSDFAADSEKQALYALVQRFAAAFRVQNGSLLCRELLGEQGADHAPTPSARTAQYYEIRPCGELVRRAAESLENFLSQEEPT